MVFNYEIQQDLSDKVALITGASSGVGKTSAYKLAAKGCHVFMANRNKEKTDPIIQDIKEKTGNQKVEFIELICDDLESVRDCARQFLAKGLPLHILMNNAGVAGQIGLSKQGFEYTFAVNHLSHFLLTELLLPVLKTSAPSRIVNVSSTGHKAGKLYDFSLLSNPDQAMLDRFFLQNYADSKLAQGLHTRKLSQLLKGTNVSTYFCHPGVVATDVWRNFPFFLQPLKWFMLTEEQGAMTQLYCATEPSIVEDSGYYFDNCQKAKYNPLVNDQNAVDDLWNNSTAFVKRFLRNL